MASPATEDQEQTRAGVLKDFVWDPREGAGLSSKLEIRKDREFPELGDGVPACAVYLDDSTFLCGASKKLEEDLRGKPGPEQERLRRACKFWGSRAT